MNFFNLGSSTDITTPTSSSTDVTEPTTSLTSSSVSSSTTKKTTATTAAPEYYVLVTDNNVNVRSGAGTNYGVVTSVKKGKELTYLGEKTVNGKKWYNVEVNGKSGWIISTYSKLVSMSSETTTNKKTTTTTVKASYILITGSTVNVRSGAGTNYSVVTTVYKGQSFRYSDVKTVNNIKWYKITANGKTGWVVGTYVKLSN